MLCFILLPDCFIIKVVPEHSWCTHGVPETGVDPDHVTSPPSHYQKKGEELPGVEEIYIRKVNPKTQTNSLIVPVDSEKSQRQPLLSKPHKFQMGAHSSRGLNPEKKPHWATVDTAKREASRHTETPSNTPSPSKAVWLQPIFTSTLCLPFFCPLLCYLFPCRQTGPFSQNPAHSPTLGKWKGLMLLHEGVFHPPWLLPFLFPLEHLWRRETPRAPCSCSEGCLCWPQMLHSNKDNSWQLSLSKLYEATLCILMTLTKLL